MIKWMMYRDKRRIVRWETQYFKEKKKYSLTQYRHSESFPECVASSDIPFTTELGKVQPGNGMLLFIFNMSHAHISNLKSRMCTRF